MITTRLPRPSVTPVVLHNASGGRRVGKGMRRGMLFAASKLRSDGAGQSPRERLGSRSRFCFHCLGASSPFLRELDDVRERGKVAQLQVLIARYVVRRAHRGKHLRLFHRVDSEIGFQVEIEIQHLLGIASLLGNNVQDSLLDRFVRSDGVDSWRRCLRWRWNRGRQMQSPVPLELQAAIGLFRQPGRAASRKRTESRGRWSGSRAVCDSRHAGCCRPRESPRTSPPA
jgi:hypothetical protein